jgi:hypothetical protein
MAEMALSQAVDEHIEKSQEVVTRISELECAILKWDVEDIRILRKNIAEIRILLQKNFQIQIDNFIPMRSIPSMRIPDEIRQIYKIIAVDKKGIALFGQEMNKIIQITKITEHYKKKKSVTPTSYKKPEK